MGMNESRLKASGRMWSMRLNDTKDMQMEERPREGLLRKSREQSRVKC